MLVLSRLVGERLCIGPNIIVAILKAEGDKISIGIQAPKHVQVDREEVRISKDKEVKRGRG